MLRAEHSRLARAYSLFAISYLLISGCTHAIPRIGMQGRYLEGKDQFLRGRGGDMGNAIVALESVVREDPTYKDSLTLLGRAYYRAGRYQDAYAILQRAVAVNKNDEIAWLVLGLTELKLGQNQKGLETVKGGITLLSKASVKGYRDYEDWDSKNLVRSSIQRTAFLAAKGLEEKDNLLRAAETLLVRIDDEENFQRIDSMQEYRRGYTSQ